MSELDSRVKKVTNQLKSLYEKYSKTFVAARTATSNSTATASAAALFVLDKRMIFMLISNLDRLNIHKKSELEVYLEEPNYIEVEYVAFDVLKWWSQNCSKFPILSKLARDIFCIPITTVASKSAFSAGGRVLDDYRSSLSKDMVELLMLWR
jgi:hAT family C-terminal dimerisation region